MPQKFALLALLPFSLAPLAPLLAAEPDPPARPFAPKFYAFQNGVAFGSLENEAKTLKELGYAGISQVFQGGEKLAERIAVYDEFDLDVLSIYLNVDDQPIAADVVKPLANRGGLIELTIRKRTPKTVAAVRATARMAAALKIRVALYPHHGFAVATMPQALALAEEVDDPNLGVMFNLCHFLKNEDVDDLETILERAAPRLFAVSTSGGDVGGAGWGQLIRPLDNGTFPQKRLFATLKKIGFDGPVGLQCFGVRGDKRENLARSVKAWRAILKDVAS